MRVCHNITAAFDDPNLIGTAGLVPVMALAQKAGLPDLVTEHVTMAGSAGANADVKVACLVAGRVAGADSIEDMDLVRHGGMDRLFTGSRARPRWARTCGPTPSATSASSTPPHPGRWSTWPGRYPACWPAQRRSPTSTSTTPSGRRTGTPSRHRVRVYRREGLNVQVAALSTPTTAPVVAGTRLRKGNVSSAHGAAHLIDTAAATAKKTGATGLLTVRADSAYYNHDVVAAARAAGARFSITARMDPAVTAAISRIPDDTWVRVKRLNPKAVKAGQDELFAAYRHHGVFTDSPLSTLEAEALHRDHAIVEQVIADLKSGPLVPRTLRVLLGQRCVDRPGGHRVQPDPGSRDAGLDRPRPCPAGHDPRPADQAPRPDRQPRPKTPPAPAHQLALAGRLDGHVRPRPRLTPTP